MNKTEVSNQITGLRPKVKQATVHLAHHLSREVTKCEKRKGPKASKFHNRAATYRKEVLLLKNIRPDDVSRYALMMDFSEREKLLNDIALPLETKVLVKLASYKTVKSHIESFRDSHPDWSSKLPHLLETLGIRAKFKKKIQKEQEKQKRKLARKQVVSSENEGKVSPNKGSGADGDLTESEEDGNNSENSDAESDSMDENESETEGGKHSKSFSDSDNDRSDSVSESDGDVEDPEDVTIHTKKKMIVAEATVKESSYSKQNSLIAEVCPFADLKQEELRERNKESLLISCPDKGANDIEQSEPESVEEDEFFVTQENSFLKTVAVKRENGEGLQLQKALKNSDEKSTPWAVDGKNLKGNRAQRRAKFLGRNVKSKRPKQTNDNQSDERHRRNSNFQPSNKRGFTEKKPFDKNRRDISKSNDIKSKTIIHGKKVTQPAESSESLHPSWEAKRKQKVSLDSFQGKKIKFDE